MQVSCLSKSIFCVVVSDLSDYLDHRSRTWEKNSQDSKEGDWYPILAISGAPVDHFTHNCCLDPALCPISICHFYDGLYIVTLTDPGVI